jgi:hypothetical protein
MLIFGFGAVGIAVVLLLVAVTQLIGGAASATPVPTPAPTCVGPNCPIAQPSPLVPKKLYVRDRTFDITPVAVQKGNWPVGAGGDANATWVFGTLVNYLIGLPNNSEYEDLLQALSEAESARAVERPAGRVQTDAQPNANEETRQHHPGLPALAGDDSAQRLVARHTT